MAYAAVISELSDQYNCPCLHIQCAITHSNIHILIHIYSKANRFKIVKGEGTLSAKKYPKSKTFHHFTHLHRSPSTNTHVTPLSTQKH